MVVSLKPQGKMQPKVARTRRSNGRRPNFSSSEVEAMVAFMEARKDLECGELGGRLAASADVRAAYEELTAVVNSVNGCLKVKRTPSEVKDKWMCFKYRTKKKAQAIEAKRDRSSTSAAVAGTADAGELVCPWDALSPLEERVVELLGRDVVYAPSYVADSLGSDAAKGKATVSVIKRRSDQNSQSGASQLPNGQSQVKIEPMSDTSNTERVHNYFRSPSPPTTNGLLRTLMDQHQLMLESLTNFQESLDTHNKIQRGILCMKYMKLKLMADERNVEVVLPAGLESLLVASNDD